MDPVRLYIHIHCVWTRMVQLICFLGLETKKISSKPAKSKRTSKKFTGEKTDNQKKSLPNY